MPAYFIAVIRQPVFDSEYFRAFAGPIGLYVVRVRFAPAELPVRCCEFNATHAEQPRSEHEIRLTSEYTALLAAQNPGPGVLGIR